MVNTEEKKQKTKHLI